jgi:hypothetical protein
VLAIDASGSPQEERFSVRTASDLAALSISEVRANPLGSEPAQEYVELWNFGARPLPVQGFSISDAPDEPGTRIVPDAILPPGARALLVSDAFDSTSDTDVRPAPGAILLRVGPTVTRAGLANSGEALFLRDREGRRLSAAPATPPPRPGVCSVRECEDPRSGAPGSFGYDPAASCTPGH